MPAQPPFLTPTRTPAIGFSVLPRMSLMRVAAASVSRMTWGRGRGLAIFISSRRVQGPADETVSRLAHVLVGEPASTSPGHAHYIVTNAIRHHMLSTTRASSD